MTRFPSLPLIPVLAALVCGLAACGPRESEQQLATEDYCRQAANRVFDTQHRDDILAQEDQTDDPRSSTGLPGVPNRGLSDQYIHENRVDDCVARRTAATEDGTTFGAQGSSPTGSAPGGSIPASTAPIDSK